MMRWLVVSLVVVACAGREVSKIKYTHSTCEGADCTIAPQKRDQFAPPDEERGLPTATPAAIAPEPTCRLVGETLASLELGNYADPEERAPKIAAGEKRCTAMKLSRDDRQCIVDSYDRASIAYCAPALFPDEPQQPALTGPQCDAIAKQMIQQLDQFMRSGQQTDQRQWERQLLASIDACRADRWNAAMGQCAQYYVPTNPQYCAYVQPTGMYKRLEARLAKAKGN
jgi:hypothetical protein